MFGYVVANIEKLTDEEKEQYRSCYCGLCRALGSRHGTLSRITLNYDITFLILLLSAIYEPKDIKGTERCIAHPIKPHPYMENEITEYAADMNIALAYFNLLDDWTDDRKLLPLAEAKLLEHAYQRVSAHYPGQCAAIRECLKELEDIEKSGILNVDIPADCFGKLMAGLFGFRADEHGEALGDFGHALGRFIYVMDACLDLKEDIRQERYNPMAASSSDNFSSILDLLMADCIEKYKRLPVRKDKNLLENILYSGVWTRYEAANNKSKEKK